MRERDYEYTYEQKRGRSFVKTLGVLGTVALGGAVIMNLPEKTYEDPTSSYETPAAPARGGKEQVGSREMVIHKHITATVFWVGESAGQNNPTHNRSSAWVEDWVGAFGGIDDPKDRCGYKPCDFTPRENPFYFALPYNDIGKDGQKSTAKLIPWYDETALKHKSQLKSRWIKVTANGKTAYGQWGDVGPFKTGDHEYVLGDAEPLDKRAGLDISPAMADYVKVDGKGRVNWQFVDASDVPKGPWKETVTR